MEGWSNCPGCRGRGHWYSPDNGQLVVCKHKPEPPDEREIDTILHGNKMSRLKEVFIHLFGQWHED